MKKLLTILISILLSAQLSAQGNNLQFSSVLTSSFEASGTATDSQTIIVPNGQVLKITSANVSHSTNRNYNIYMILFFKENSSSQYTMLASGSENANSYFGNNSMPVWLKSGTYDFKLDNFQNSGTGTAIITGIFFNIAP